MTKCDHSFLMLDQVATIKSTFQGCRMLIQKVSISRFYGITKSIHVFPCASIVVVLVLLDVLGTLLTQVASGDFIFIFYFLI